MLFAPVLPLLIICALATWYQWESQKEDIYESHAETASVISLALDREIERSRAILYTLAASELIDAKDWRAFHRLASEAIRNEPDSFIALAEPSGMQPVRTMVPYDTPPVNPLNLARTHTEVEWNGRRLPLSTQGLSRQVFETGKMANSSLYFGVSIKKPAVSIAVPVMRNGRVAYVLIKGFAVDALVKVLQDAGRPNMRIALIDANGRVIARNVNPEAAIGSMVNAPLIAALKANRQGTREGINLDGVRTVSAFRHLDRVDWIIHVSTPKSAALAAATRNVFIWSVLGLALIAVGFYGARRFWMRIAPPIALLGQSARAIQRGEAMELPQSEIAEIDELTILLRDAAAAENRERAEAMRRAVAEESERATRKLVEALTQSEARFRTIFEHSGTGMGTINLETGRFVLVNRRLCEITGYSEQDLLQRTFTDITHPEDQARDAAAVRQLATGRRQGCDAERRYVRKDGSVRWAELHVRRVPEATADEALSFASITDITERKEAERTLKAADQRKDEFLATLAHELRNPLAPLRTGLDILKVRHADSAVLAKVRTVMERQVNHMVRLIDDLLDVSRITTGRLQLHKAPVDLADVVGAAVEACQSVVDAGGHKLSVTIEDAPLTVNGDSTRLVQVVENLLTNAAKYSEIPGEITVNAFRRGDRAVVSVRDTGIGIPPGKREVIFDMFAQVHGTRGSGKDRGLGIGLHIVKRLVELHKGTVVAHSDGDGTGSEFVVELPWLHEPIAAAPQKTVPHTTDAPLSILVVDDNRDAAESLAALLDILGHKVHTAFSGSEALGMVARVCPEILLLDIGMPDIDGYEVARRIRASSLAAQPVIVAVSGWGQADDKNKTSAAGFDHHLVKPVDLVQLQHIIAAAKEAQGDTLRH